MKLLTLLLSAGVAVLATSAAAQPYPSKPVTIIVPYAAGGETDAIARVFAARLTEEGSGASSSTIRQALEQ